MERPSKSGSFEAALVVFFIAAIYIPIQPSSLLTTPLSILLLEGTTSELPRISYRSHCYVCLTVTFVICASGFSAAC